MSPSKSTAAPAGPTRPGNPNPRAADQNTPPSTIAPHASTNQTIAPSTSTSKKRPSSTLKDAFVQANKKRKAEGAEPQVRKQRVPVAKGKAAISASGKTAATTTPPAEGDPKPDAYSSNRVEDIIEVTTSITTSASDTTKKPFPANTKVTFDKRQPSSREEPQTKAPINGQELAVAAWYNAVTSPWYARPGLTEEEKEIAREERTERNKVQRELRMKELRESLARNEEILAERMARRAVRLEEAAAKKKKAPAKRAVQQKSKASVDDDSDSEEDRPSPKKSRTTSKTSDSQEKSSSNTSLAQGKSSQGQNLTREGRKVRREQQREETIALESMKSTRGSQEDEQQTGDPHKEVNASTTAQVAAAKGRPAISSKKTITTLEVKSKAGSDKKEDPPKRTARRNGKSSAVDSDSNGSTIYADSDSGSDEPQKLTQTELQQRQQKQKKQRALDTLAQRRRERDTQKTARSSSSSKSPPTNSSPDETSTAPQPTEEAAADCITVAGSADSRSRSNSAENSASSGSGRPPRSEIRRKLFRD